MRDGLIISFLSLIPQRPAARMMGVLARTGISKLFLRAFAWRYRINLTECEGEIGDYATLSDFFLRPLKPGVRPILSDPAALVSPVDGTVHTFGRIERGQFAQSDTATGSIAELIGEGDSRIAAAPLLSLADYEGGWYAVIYLSPRDYHRVHTPFAGTVPRYRYLPGKLWPVFPAATRKVEGLFQRNERLVFPLQTEQGPMVVALIGAFGVGRMSTPLAPITTNTASQAEDGPLTPPPALARGAELGRFGLGSTVILLLPPVDFAWTIRPGQSVRLGEGIGRFNSAAP